MYHMTGRERSIKAMNFEATDRLPIMANTLPADFVIALTGIPAEQYWADQLTAHIQSMKMLGMDFYIQNWFPAREQTDKPWSRGELERWSIVENVAEDMEHEIARLDRTWQTLRADAQRREARIQEICTFQTDMQRRCGEDLLWTFAMDYNGAHVLEFPYETYGYEGFFLVCAAYPDVMDRYWAAQARLARWHNECMVEAAHRLDYPKIAYLGTDMTDQRGNMVSPRFMDQHYFPHLDYALQPLVNDGFKLVWHCDGNVNDLLGPLISIGINGFQGFQEECGTRIKDVARLRARNGDPLILWGSVSVINVVEVGTEDDIRREIQRVLDEWPHPGLCLGTSSYIPPTTPPQNIFALYRLMHELGTGLNRHL